MAKSASVLVVAIEPAKLNGKFELQNYIKTVAWDSWRVNGKSVSKEYPWLLTYKRNILNTKSQASISVVNLIDHCDHLSQFQKKIKTDKLLPVEN